MEGVEACKKVLDPDPREHDPIWKYLVIKESVAQSGNKINNRQSLRLCADCSL